MCLPPGHSHSRASSPAPSRAPARQLARFAELPAYTPTPPKQLSRASGLALFMLAAGKPDSPVGWTIVAREIALLASELGRVHRARGELERARQLEAELGGELAQIEAALERDRSHTGEVLDAEAQAARRAREPLPPPARNPGRQGAGEAEDVKRQINPLRRRKPRGQ